MLVVWLLLSAASCMKIPWGEMIVEDWHLDVVMPPAKGILADNTILPETENLFSQQLHHYENFKPFDVLLYEYEDLGMHDLDAGLEHSLLCWSAHFPHLLCYILGEEIPWHGMVNYRAADVHAAFHHGNLHLAVPDQSKISDLHDQVAISSPCSCLLLFNLVFLVWFSLLCFLSVVSFSL